jgi:hypothetical protein
LPVDTAPERHICGRVMKPTIDLYCGDPIDVESEKIFFLERLRADLLALNAPALIIANFVTPKNPLQIDYLVVTLGRVCHVELEQLTAPVVGGSNGPCAQPRAARAGSVVSPRRWWAGNAKSERCGRVWRIYTGGRGQVVTIVGEAGIGKTQVKNELRENLPAGVRWLEGRCQSYTQSTSYAPIAVVPRTALGFGAVEASAIAGTKLRVALRALAGERMDQVQGALAHLLSLLLAESRRLLGPVATHRLSAVRSASRRRRRRVGGRLQRHRRCARTGAAPVLPDRHEPLFLGGRRTVIAARQCPGAPSAGWGSTTALYSWVAEDPRTSTPSVPQS